MRMKKLLFIMATMLLPLSLYAQRIQQKLERSVVAVHDKGASKVFVSWRKLAQEPENCTYNLYKRAVGSTNYTKVNSTPIANTNFQTTRSQIPFNSELAVTTVANGVESEKSNPFLFKKQAWGNVFMDINFETKVLTPNNYRTTCVWPMDLDGNGEDDAVLMNRLYSGGAGNDPGCNTTSHKLQAYTLDGKCLWTIDAGLNVDINAGQNDLVTVYDINCDGKCEVIMKSSDGTRFWDIENNTWGKYVMGAANGDTDGDGIINYRPSTQYNPPFYISIIDGQTGAEIVCSEMKYSELNDGLDSYARDNRANYYNDNEGTEYAFMSGKFAICYFDGVHPSLALQCYNRARSTGHHYYLTTWTFDWNNGKPSNWHHDKTWAFRRDGQGAAEFHQLRVVDVDGDGIDEVCEGGYSWNPIKLQIGKPYIGHGDRFDISDIDPDRPGLEVFAIQQSNLLGQIIYAAESGEHLKEWYLSSMGDVGRGRCMDVDLEHKGYEAYSTMGNLYDCKGNVIKEGGVPFPVEAIWWDADLQREQIASPGGRGFDQAVHISKYNGTRLIEITKESSNEVHTSYGIRVSFVGDMTGDWREEVILMKQTEAWSKGIVGYTTNIPTDVSMYTLMEDPHYRLDCTCRGYYQSPYTGFYLGGDMPYPQLPPVMTADKRYRGGGQWSASSSKDAFSIYNMTEFTGVADGSSYIFDISGDNKQPINIEGTIKPSVVYIMNPKEHDYTFAGTGQLAGTMDLWKSQQGTATFNMNLDYTGKTIISEGTLCVNGKIAGDVDLRARGSLAGVATLQSDITFEGGLHYEGCRLMPGSDTDKYGVMTFAKSLTLPGEVYVVCNAAAGKASKIMVNGDLTLTGKNTFTIAINEEKLAAGEYVLAECTGVLTANVASIKTRGLEGVNYSIAVRDKQVILTVTAMRAPKQGVLWTGNESNVWDYKANNFSVEGSSTSFVTDDAVIFNDNSGNRSIVINEQMMPSNVVFDFNNGTYTIKGNGGIGGTGTLTKNGKGELKMLLTGSDYTGATIINEGTLTVDNLADGGVKSALGASPATQGNLQLNGGTLKVDAINMATNHIVTITDTSSVDVVRSNAAISFTNRVTGTGYLVKTGAGQLNFTYSGVNPIAGVIVKQGKIAQGAWNTTFGKVGSPMLLAGGTVQLLDVNSSSTRPILDHKITVQEGTKNTIIGTTRGAINGSFYGKGEVAINSFGVRNDIGSNFYNFEGTLVVQGGSFRLMDNVVDMSKTTVVMDAESYMAHYSSNGSSQRAVTTKIGSLTSTATDCTIGHSSDSYEVGYLGKDDTYKGLMNAKSIKKVGAGTWTLYTPGSTSAISVEGGALQAYNNSSTLAALTTGLITVKAGGALVGTGCVGTASVQKGGVINAGYNGGYGVLKALNKVTLAQGGTLRVDVGKNSNGTLKNDKYQFNGAIAHSGDTILINIEDDVTLAVGNTITVFSGTGTQSGSYIIKTVSATQTITWDDSQLFSDGILKVADIAAGINDVTIADEAMVDVYSVDGIRLLNDVRYGDAQRNLAPGIYVINGQKITIKRR